MIGKFSISLKCVASLRELALIKGARLRATSYERPLKELRMQIENEQGSSLSYRELALRRATSYERPLYMINAYKNYVKDLQRKMYTAERAYDETGVSDFFDTKIMLAQTIKDLKETIRELTLVKG